MARRENGPTKCSFIYGLILKTLCFFLLDKGKMRDRKTEFEFVNLVDGGSLASTVCFVRLILAPLAAVSSAFSTIAYQYIEGKKPGTAVR